jgi:hypothetical protein
MKLKTHILSFFLITLANFSFAQKAYLDKSGGSAKMMVDGKPFLIMGGELHNSTGSDMTALPQVFKEMKAMNLNTVLTYAYWEHIEPVEGQFNFDLVDAAINAAKNEEIKLIMVWFGSWKSTASTYAPAWIKTNPKRFPRYALENGNTLEILSPFFEENMKADMKAYKALVQHIKEVDTQNTVIMMQVENEPGCFENYRDYTSQGQKAWEAQMPNEMVNYLKQNEGNLYPELEKVWAANGKKTKGTWEEILGKSSAEGDYKYYPQELFMAYYYSKYINYIAAEGKKVLDLPTFCNGWLYNNRGFYPHGTVNPHVLDAYRAAGSAMDFYSPNVYTIDYDELFSKYTLANNTLFVPESMLSPAGALYSIGAYNSLGFAPFGIDGSGPKKEDNAVNLALLKQINKTLDNMAGIITASYHTEKMNAVYINQSQKKDVVSMGDYIITATTSNERGFNLEFGKSLDQVGKNNIPGVADEKQAAPAPFGTVPKGLASSIIIQSDTDEFYFIGYGVRLNFELKEAIKLEHLGFLSIDEGDFVNEKFILKKRWNGDEQKVKLPEDHITVLKVKFYRN